jgi:cobalamin-dependent methionine synthase I
MREAVQKIQEAVSVPLSIDSPDFEIIKAGLEAYDPGKGGGKPLVNSISALRTDVFDLLRSYPARAILLLTEMKSGTESKACTSAQEEHACAQDLHRRARESGLDNDDILFDPGIAPIGADTEGRLRQTVETLALLADDPAFSPLHASVGLSNFTIMLPRRTPGGMPIRSSLESAFLTLAMPLGLDTIIGSVKRNYTILGEEDPALVCLKEILVLDGFETLSRLDEYCRG